MEDDIKENYLSRLRSIKERNASLLALYSTLTSEEERIKLKERINSEAKEFYDLKQEYERYMRIKQAHFSGKISNNDFSSYQKSLTSTKEEKPKRSLINIISYIAIIASVFSMIGLGIDRYSKSTESVVPRKPTSSITEVEQTNEEQLNIDILNRNNIYDKVCRASNGKRFLYDKYYPTKNGELSLIIYLHGAGGGFPDQTYSLPRMLKKGEVETSSVVLIPKTNGGTGSNTFGGSANMREGLIELIKETIEEDNIKPDKVIVIGHSYGADAAIRLASEYPEEFSCVVPISGEVIKGYDIENLTDTNILFFSGSKEGRIKQNMSTLSNRINSESGNASFEVIPNKGHMDICSYIFGQTDLLDKVTEYNKYNRTI